MGRKNPNLNRRSHVIEPKPRFIIFCEGKNTEPRYFTELQNQYRDALIKIESHGGGGVPLTIAKQAAKQKKELRKSKLSAENADQVWAVFDRDDHPGYIEAINLCDTNGVGVGRSNPCFELWLILHMEEYDRPDGRSAVQAHLSKLHSDYDPKSGKTLNCTSIIAQVEKAEARAERQLANREKEKEGNSLGPPYSTVFRLTRAFRSAANRTTRKV